MAFNQNKLARSIIQTQGIYNKYVYETDDTIADVTTAGYFSESRFIDIDGPQTNGMGWVGGIIECQCSDGYFIGVISEDGDSLTGATPSGGSITESLEDGQVPKYDDATSSLVYGGATVDPDTGEWTFDEAINVPPGSVSIGSQSISNAGFAMQWIDSSTDLEYLFISDQVPSDSGTPSGDLVRYKLDAEEIFNNQTVAIDVISPKDGNGDVFYVLPNAADGLNSIFTAIIYEAGEFDFFIRLNSHTDAPIFQQRVIADSSDAQVNTITGITNATNAVVTFSADHQYVTGDVPVFNEIVGMTEFNLLPGIEIVGTTSNTITLDVDSTTFGTYVSGGLGYKERLFPLSNPLLLLGAGTLLYVELRPVDGSQISSRGGDFGGLFIPWLRAFSRPANTISIVDEFNVTAQLGKNAYARLNSEYESTAAVTTGLVTNYQATVTIDTVTSGQFTEGVAATSNPTVITDGSGVFAQNDIIQISGSSNNDGFYEVEDHTGATLTVRGVGTVATVEDWSEDDFVTMVDSCSITKVNVAVLRAGTGGIWQVGSGSATPLTYSDVDSTAAPGNDTNIMFNNAGVEDGSDDFTYDDATKTVTLTGSGSNLPTFVADDGGDTWQTEYESECIRYSFDGNQILDIGSSGSGASSNLTLTSGTTNGTYTLEDNLENTVWQLGLKGGTFVEIDYGLVDGVKVIYSNAPSADNFYEENVVVSATDTYLEYKRGDALSTRDKRIAWTTGALDPASYSLTHRIQAEGDDANSANIDYLEYGWDKDANSGAGGYVIRTDNAGTGTAYDLDIQEGGAGEINLHTDTNLVSGALTIGDTTGLTPSGTADDLVIASQGLNTGLSILVNNNAGATNNDAYLYLGSDEDPTETGLRGDLSTGRLYMRSSGAEPWFFRGDGALVRTSDGGGGDNGAVISMDTSNSRVIRVDNSEDICYEASDNTGTASSGSHNFEVVNSGASKESVFSISDAAITASRDLNVTGDGDFTGRVDASNLPSNASEGTFTDAAANYSSPDPLAGTITTAARNVILGDNSGNSLTTELNNTIIGTNSANLILGDGNTLIGSFLGALLETGDHNVIIGESSASLLEDGGYNVIIGGESTAGTLATGSNNITIGQNADVPAGITSNFISLNNLIYGDTNLTKVRIGGSGAFSGSDEELVVTGDARATNQFITSVGFLYDDDTGVVLENNDPVEGGPTFQIELSSDDAVYRKSDQGTVETGEHRFQYLATGDIWTTSLVAGAEGVIAENEFKTNAGTVIKTTVTAVSADFPSGTTVFAVTNTAAARTITILTADIANTGKEFIIKDESGTANGTNSITIVGEGGENIDGSTSVIIDAPYGSVRLYAKSNQLWTI